MGDPPPLAIGTPTADHRSRVSGAGVDTARPWARLTAPAAAADDDDDEPAPPGPRLAERLRLPALASVAEYASVREPGRPSPVAVVVVVVVGSGEDVGLRRGEESRSRSSEPGLGCGAVRSSGSVCSRNRRREGVRATCRRSSHQATSSDVAVSEREVAPAITPLLLPALALCAADRLVLVGRPRPARNAASSASGVSGAREGADMVSLPSPKWEPMGADATLAAPSMTTGSAIADCKIQRARAERRQPWPACAEQDRQAR